MPFDFVKTQMQKQGFITGTTFKIMRGFYNRYGVRTLYTGWQFKAFQYILQSIFTVMTLESLELKSKNLHK
jgi:hypothetical protein